MSSCPAVLLLWSCPAAVFLLLCLVSVCSSGCFSVSLAFLCAFSCCCPYFCCPGCAYVYCCSPFLFSFLHCLACFLLSALLLLCVFCLFSVFAGVGFLGKILSPTGHWSVQDDYFPKKSRWFLKGKTKL